MALRDYLAGEITQDFSDGILSRREALRRLGLLGLGASAAAFLAACGDDGGDEAAPADDGDGESTSTSTAGTGDATGTGGDAQLVAFRGPSGEVKGAFASASDPKGSVLVVHENRGLTPHFFDLVGRLADAGYAALAVDLLSPEGGTATINDDGRAQAALGQASLDRLVGDLGAGIDELERRNPDLKVGAVGFCFGGGMVWNLLDAGEDRLDAAVPFYGPVPSSPDFGDAKAAVLGIYAGLDSRVNASRPQAETALKDAGLEYEIKTYPDVDHAFFNDTGARYNQAAATEAYAAVLGWFDEHLT